MPIQVIILSRASKDARLITTPRVERSLSASLMATIHQQDHGIFILDKGSLPINEKKPLRVCIEEVVLWFLQ